MHSSKDTESPARLSDRQASVPDPRAEMTPSSDPNQASLSSPLANLHDILPQASLQSDEHSGQTSPTRLEAKSHDECLSGTGSNNIADESVSFSAPVVTTRHWSLPAGFGGDSYMPSCRWQNQLPSVAGTSSDGSISKQTIETILCHINTYLSDRRLSACSDKLAEAATDSQVVPTPSAQTPPDDAQSKASKESAKRYLVTSDDVERMLDIVIAGVRSARDDGTQSECRSLLFPEGTPAKPSLRTENIVPCMSSMADPATTIYNPQPCFSSTGFVEDASGQRSTPKATYSLLVSRRSITEINWGSFPDHLHHDNVPTHNAELSFSEAGAIKHYASPWSLQVHSPQSTRSSWSQPRRFPPGLTFDFGSNYEPAGPSERHFRWAGPQRATSEPSDRCPFRDHCRHVTTLISPAPFPRLISRSCTNDWLTPLGLFETTEVERQMVPSISSAGEDIHNGAYIYSTLPILEEDTQSSPSLQTQNRRSFQQNSSLSRDDSGQRFSLASEGGSVTGTEPGHHGKVNVRGSRDGSRTPHGDFLDGLRCHSIISLLDDTADCIPGGVAVQASRAEIPSERRRRGRSSLEVLRDILDRSDTSATRASRSKSEPLAAASGFEREHSQDPGPCFEDQTPHVCTDEQDSLVSF
ncbi:hypothetical protein GGR50DRAFT_319004 [Xylaria sp. CBS 124048]|nr:hypothetical protein GGR50DRAFT_319004 [Xylaria sp. CBS 124048]